MMLVLYSIWTMTITYVWKKNTLDCITAVRHALTIGYLCPFFYTTAFLLFSKIPVAPNLVKDIFGLVWLAANLVISVVLIRSTSKASLEVEWPPLILISVPISLYMLPMFFLTLQTPVWGWDALQYWVFQGKLLITSEWRHEIFGQHFSLYPNLLSLVQGGSASSTSAYSIATWHLFTYAVILASMINELATASRCRWGSVIVGLSFAALPLVENHVQIIGYAELSVAALLLLAVNAAVTAESYLDHALVVFTLLFLIFTKNSGIIYALPVALCLLFRLVKSRRSQIRRLPPLAISAVATLAVIVLVVTPNVWDMTFEIIDWNKIKIRDFVFAIGTSFSFEPLLSFPNAILINSSFATLSILCSICLLHSVFSKNQCDPRLLTCLSIVVIIFLVLGLVPSLGSAAVHGSDTTGSRWLVPVAPISLLAGSLYILRTLQRPC